MRVLIAAAIAVACAAASTPWALGQEAGSEADKKLVEKDFSGFQLGVGLSLTLDAGENDRVTEAAIVNGLVRVTNEDNAIARLMFETHYFFVPKGCLFALGSPGKCALLEPDQWGWGPFVAVQPGEGEIVDTIGIGLMLGFRRPGRTDSFNLGIGGVVDPNARVFGDGIVENQPLPTGETEIRFKEKEQWGWVFITSYTF